MEIHHNCIVLQFTSPAMQATEIIDACPECVDEHYWPHLIQSYVMGTCKDHNRVLVVMREEAGEANCFTHGDSAFSRDLGNELWSSFFNGVGTKRAILLSRIRQCVDRCVIRLEMSSNVFQTSLQYDNASSRQWIAPVFDKLAVGLEVLERAKELRLSGNRLKTNGHMGLVEFQLVWLILVVLDYSYGCQEFPFNSPTLIHETGFHTMPSSLA